MPEILTKIYPKGFTAFLTGNIYLKRSIFEDLQKKKPNPKNVSILLHEKEHRKRSGLSNALKYQIYPKFRLNEELIAYRAQFKYLKKKGSSYDLDLVAKKLSGPIYFYSTNYKKAKKILKKVWQEA